MAAVLRLIPDALALPVEHRLGDLLARMGREAVQRDRARRGRGQQLVVELVAGAAPGVRAAAVSGESFMLTQTSV